MYKRPGSYVALFRGELVLVHFNGLCSVVEFSHNITYLQAELGPAILFEILGEF